MFWQGIPWSYAAVGAAVGGGAVIALFFLKVRYPELQVPSVMLWRAAEPESRRTVLWNKLGHWLHLLCLLAAVMAIAAALAQPVWRFREVPPVAVVAEPSALKDAEKVAAAGDPGQTVLIAAGAAPEVIRGFRSPPAPHAIPPENGGINRSDALRLARQWTADRNGRVFFFGASAPPWLPENSFWVRRGLSAEPTGPPPWRIYFSGVPRPDSLPSGMTAAETPEGADVIVDDLENWGTPKGWAKLFGELRVLRGFHADGLQHLSVSESEAGTLPKEIGSLRLSNGLWLLAFLLLALDLWWWTRRKLV